MAGALLLVLGGLLLLVALVAAYIEAGVLPGLGLVGALVGVEPAEQPVEVLRVAEVLADEERRVCVSEDVVAKPQVVAQHVVDEPAEQSDVAAGTNRDVDVGER